MPKRTGAGVREKASSGEGDVAKIAGLARSFCCRAKHEYEEEEEQQQTIKIRGNQ